MKKSIEYDRIQEELTQMKQAIERLEGLLPMDIEPSRARRVLSTIRSSTSQVVKWVQCFEN
jgi:hypothetical protein